MGLGGCGGRAIWGSCASLPSLLPFLKVLGRGCGCPGHLMTQLGFRGRTSPIRAGQVFVADCPMHMRCSASIPGLLFPVVITKNASRNCQCPQGEGIQTTPVRTTGSNWVFVISGARCLASEPNSFHLRKLSILPYTVQRSSLAWVCRGCRGG